MARRDPKKKGMPIEEFRHQKFNAEIRFDKESGDFRAAVPGDEIIKAKSLEELRQALRKYANTYVMPGGWVKKILVNFNRDAGANYSAGIPYETKGLTLGFSIFEEREFSPENKRICREWVDPTDEEGPSRRKARRSEEGEDQRWALRDAKVLLWTQEREDVLAAIQKALMDLGTRLEEVVEKPELAAGNIQKLLGG